MFEIKTHTIRKYILSIDGKEIAIRTKRQAISYGKSLTRQNIKVKLIEKETVIAEGYKKTTVLSVTKFDRTFLINPKLQ